MNGPTSYSWQISDALHFPVRDPFRFLALAVLLRWRQDVADGRKDTELGPEWAEAADIPEEWLAT